jgi:hypothetical protein
MRSAKHNSTPAVLLFLSLALAFAQVCSLGCEFLGCAFAAQAAPRAESTPASHCHRPEPEPRQDESRPDCGKHALAATFEPASVNSSDFAQPLPNPAAEVFLPLGGPVVRQTALADRWAAFHSPPHRGAHTVLRI